MERWRDDRATRPLSAWLPDGERGERAMASQGGDELDISQTRTMSLPAVRPGQGAAHMAPVTRPIQLESGAAPATDDEELERIREILVGAQLREHDRRLREMERRHGELLARTMTRPATPEMPAEWQARVRSTEAELARQSQTHEAQRAVWARALDELRTELQVTRAELTRERQSREELARSHALTLTQLSDRVERARAETGADPRMAQALGELQAQHDVLRSELARERMSREEVAQTHAHALGDLTNRLGEHQEGHGRTTADLANLVVHVDALRAAHDDHTRRVAVRTAELEARLESERQAHAEQIERLERAQTLRSETLQKLLADAERMLAALQAERQALTAQLAELRLHLVRQASGEGIHRAPGI